MNLSKGIDKIIIKNTKKFLYLCFDNFLLTINTLITTAAKNSPDIKIPIPPALHASCTGGTETKTVASPPMAKKPITPKFINPANPHCIFTPIAITAEIKQRFNIDRAMPQD